MPSAVGDLVICPECDHDGIVTRYLPARMYGMPEPSETDARCLCIDNYREAQRDGFPCKRTDHEDDETCEKCCGCEWAT